MFHLEMREKHFANPHSAKQGEYQCKSKSQWQTHVCILAWVTVYSQENFASWCKKNLKERKKHGNCNTGLSIFAVHMYSRLSRHLIKKRSHHTKAHTIAPNLSHKTQTKPRTYMGLHKWVPLERSELLRKQIKKNYLGWWINMIFPHFSLVVFDEQKGKMIVERHRARGVRFELVYKHLERKIWRVN